MPSNQDGKKVIQLDYPLELNKKSKFIKVDIDGSFKDSLENNTGLYGIFDGTYPFHLYMTSSGAYDIKYDANNFKTGKVILSGDDVEINEYFILKAKQRVLFSSYEKEISEKDHRRFLEGIKVNALNTLAHSALPLNLKQQERKSINYEYLHYLNLYITIKMDSEAGFEPSSTSVKELTIDYDNDEDYDRYSYYQRLVFEHYMTKFRNQDKILLKADSSYSWRQNRIILIAQYISSEKLKNHLIEEVALSDIQGAKDIEGYYGTFKKLYTGNNNELLISMNDTHQKLVKLNKGTQSPEFKDYLNYQGGKNSLEDFRGKYLYIDLWATWCGNCWSELPYLLTLEKQYEGKNIAFLSISLDRDSVEWKSAINKNKMGKLQLLATKLNDSFQTNYAINGIPRYIFLNPNGMIIQQSAPRPSDTEKINKLFKSVGL